jgi:hypothetical protein
MTKTFQGPRQARLANVEIGKRGRLNTTNGSVPLQLRHPTITTMAI